MREYHLHGTDYEMKVLEVKDDGDSTVILQTIVEEGETAEKKYRINLGVKNPLTQNFFGSEDARMDYCKDMPERYWDAWYEAPDPLPAPEEGGE